jgi:hypothetical protein
LYGTPIATNVDGSIQSQQFRRFLGNLVTETDAEALKQQKRPPEATTFASRIYISSRLILPKAAMIYRPWLSIGCLAFVTASAMYTIALSPSGTAHVSKPSHLEHNITLGDPHDVHYGSVLLGSAVVYGRKVSPAFQSASEQLQQQQQPGKLVRSRVS